MKVLRSIIISINWSAMNMVQILRQRLHGKNNSKAVKEE